MSDVVYTKVTQYAFNVLGWQLALEFDNQAVYIEEMEKNGQEDTHMNGTVLRNDDGTFKWEEGERRMFVDYGSSRLADGIIEFLDTHGVPSDSNTR